MLTPEYLNKCPEYFVQLYQELEDFILQDVARRIAKAGEITDTAQWQMLRLKELGMATKEIRQKITQINEMTLREINAVFQNAARESFDFEEKIYSKAGRKPIPLEENEALQALLSAAMQQTAGEMRNFTQSLGFMEMVNGKAVFRPIADVYQNTLDLMQMTVSTGAMDVKSAVRTATKRLMDSGVRTVDYASGWVNHVDVAARRAIVTGVNQLSAKMTDQLADDLGAEFFETTAHARARPSHQVWQGQVFHRGGAKDGYPDFESATGLGTVGGLCGANCRHSYFPFFPGISVRAYSQKRLENIDPPPVTYNGKTYTAYESTQKQRQMETAMRKTKREMLGYEAAGLEEDFTSAAIKLKRQQEAYAEFSKAAGIHKQTERAQVVGFGHSQASRASWAYRKVAEKVNTMYNLGSESANVKAYLQDEPIREEILTGKWPLNIDWGKQGKHIQGHNNYIPGRSYLTISEKEMQELVNRYAGTGELLRDTKGIWKKQETIHGEVVVGYSVDPFTGQTVKTQDFKIHYSKSGVHIVPKKEKL